MLYCVMVGSAHHPPVPGLLLLQELEDGLPVHVWRGVQAGDVQDGRRQVDVEHQMRVPTCKRHTLY